MKKLLLFVLCCVSFFSCRREVVLDKEHFPDDAFRNAIGLYLSLSEGDVIPEETLAGIVDMDLSRLDIRDLKGIEYFTNLKDLYCGDNSLTGIDLSKNVALETVELYGNSLTNLDVTHNPSLKRLGCSFNQLTSIDVSKNPELNTLLCNDNPLENIDVSQNPKLHILGVNYCRLDTLDVSHNPELSTLYCTRNKFKVIDLSNNPEMSHLTYDEPVYGVLQVIRPEGKPDLGKGGMSWSDRVGRFQLSDRAMEAKHRDLVKYKGEPNYFRSVPYDSLEFEKLMSLMEDDLEVMRSIQIKTLADTLKLSELTKIKDSYPDVVYFPTLHDSLQVSQQARLDQNRDANLDEMIRLLVQLKKAGVKDTDDMLKRMKEEKAMRELERFLKTYSE